MAEEGFVDAQDTKGKRRKGEGSSRAIPNFRWRPILTRALLDFLVGQVKEGVRGNKFAAAANYISQEFNVQVAEPHVSNHMRGWRAKWTKVLTCKGLSGVGWDDDKKMIVMGSTEFKTYVAAHPGHEPFLNKPLEFHDELEIIFGTDVARGKHARGAQDGMGGSTSLDDDEENSGEEDDDVVILGGQNSPYNSPNEPKRSKGSAQTMSISMMGKGKPPLHPSAPSFSGSRRTSSQNVMNKIAASMEGISKTLLATKEEENDRESKLPDALRELVGQEYDYFIFTKEHVSRAMDFLMEHPSIAKVFLRRDEEEKRIWMAQFLAALGY